MKLQFCVPTRCFRRPGRASGLELDSGRKTPLHRLALLAALLIPPLGCRVTSEPPTGRLEMDLVHRDPRIRVEATILAEKFQRRDLIALLVENLDDDDINVRMVSGIALRKLSGRDFGFRPYESPSQRQRAVELWRRWLKEEQPADAAADQAPPELPGDGDRPEAGIRSPDSVGLTPADPSAVGFRLSAAGAEK